MDNKEVIEFLKVSGKMNQNLHYKNRVVSKEFMEHTDVWSIKENVGYMDKIGSILNLEKEVEVEVFSFLLNQEIQNCYPLIIKSLYNTLVFRDWTEKIKFKSMIANMRQDFKGIYEHRDIDSRNEKIDLLKNTIYVCWKNNILVWFNIDIRDIIDSKGGQFFHKRFLAVTNDKEVYLISHDINKLDINNRSFKVILRNTPILIIDDDNNLIDYYDWRYIGYKIGELKINNIVAMIDYE